MCSHFMELMQQKCALKQKLILFVDSDKVKNSNKINIWQI